MKKMSPLVIPSFTLLIGKMNELDPRVDFNILV